MSIHTILSQTIESEILKMKVLCDFNGLSTSQILSIENQLRSFATRIVEEVGKEYKKKVYIEISKEIIKVHELIKKCKEKDIEFPYMDYMDKIETLEEIRTKLQKMKGEV